MRRELDGRIVRVILKTETSVRSSALPTTVYGVLTSARHTARYRAVELVPDRQVDFQRLPCRTFTEYYGRVELTSDHADGTLIRWQVAYAPRIRFINWIYRLSVAYSVVGHAREIARQAENREYDSPLY